MRCGKGMALEDADGLTVCLGHMGYSADKDHDTCLLRSGIVFPIHHRCKVLSKNLRPLFIDSLIFKLRSDSSRA